MGNRINIARIAIPATFALVEQGKGSKRLHIPNRNLIGIERHVKKRPIALIEYI